MKNATVLAVLAAAVAGVAALPASRQPEMRRLGFTAADFARHRPQEEKFAASVSAGTISQTHRELTRRPHRSGTDGARLVAEYLRDELTRAGLEVEVPEYLAYLSSPRRVQIDLVVPVAASLTVMEPADPRDPDTAHPDLDPGFVAYSASGDVTAPIVYVNYGLPADYARLAAAGVTVKGRIALARYSRSHRAVKVHTAEREGAAAVILYSDPADDGSARGATWPDGLWRAEHFLQRGNAKYSWLWHGDPLTPGVAATADAPALAPAEAPTLPKIPVAVLSAHEAQKILARLQGPEAPEAFRGGLPLTYHLGDEATRVRLQVEMDNARLPIRNVIARLRGTSEAGREVILGTHHDAWTFGGIDPGSSAAVIVEVARRLAALRAQGWQPRRTLTFAFWDAEEYGLIGSTEYAEERARELQERAVIYINSDMYTPGRFVAGGVPSLRDFTAEVARDLRQPFSGELSALGSGADFVAFQDHLGIPTLALEFQFEGGYGFGGYHSSYDNRFYMERVSDPGFHKGMELARILGVTVMRFAAAPIVPFRPSHYAHRIQSFLKDAEGWRFDGQASPAAVDTSALQAQAERVQETAQAVERALDDALAQGRVPANAAAVNDGLARLEQTLIDASAPADRRWFRHVVYGWNIYSMYDGQPLPDLAEAIRLNDANAIRREQERIGQALSRLHRGLAELQSTINSR